MVQRRLRGMQCLLALAAVALSIAAFSQAPTTPTPEQLEAFQNLPPEQQRSVLEAMSGGRGGQQVDETRTQRDRDIAPAGGDRNSVPRLTQDRLGGAQRIEPPKITARSTLILQVDLRDAVGTSQPYTETERQIFRERRARIVAGNPYEVDEDARLTLPFLPPIALGDLTDAQAAQRLNADPRLDGLHFAVTLLPVRAVGHEALKPFGYDLFKEGRERFETPEGIGTPADYIIGPGDNLSIELFGKKNGRYRLVVNRDGAITIPDFGPIQVSGMSFDQLREELERRVSEQMIGVRASVSMGELRSLRVFVVGDVLSPGSHSVSGLSTITSALFASGGVSEVGSLRNIELKRRGQTVTRFDLYDLLLSGDTSKDLSLEQGDAIFVPPVGLTAGVVGQVRRPAIYEFRDGATVGELVRMAGGLHPQAALNAARLERIQPSGERTVVDLDLAGATDRQRVLQPGDILTVPKVFDEVAGSVTLEGYVQRPGPYAWRNGMRLTDVLGGLDALRLNADQRYVLIRRQRMPDRTLEVVSADAVAAFAARGSGADPVLESRDRIIVFSRQADRGNQLATLLQDMRLQNRDNTPVPVITVGGRVRSPGEYPLEANMTVGDAVRAGGGLDDAAYAQQAELTRYELVNGEARKTEVIDVELAGRDPQQGSQIPLRPYDVVLVKEVPEWRDQEFMTLLGEVRFPGRYPVRKGETISSVIDRAGGLTDGAFAKGSVFTRHEIREQEREQIDKLATRMQSDLSVLAVQSSQTESQDAGEALAAGQALLAQLRSSQPTGRLVIDLEAALANKGSSDDLQIRNNDQLIVPRLKQYVTVIGEVQSPTSHVWKVGLGRNDYVSMSGGTTLLAAEKQIYVVRANGGVVPVNGERWFSREQFGLEPGDTIVVPLDAERMRPLPLWTAVSTIVYNIAVAVAAVNSF